MLVRGATLALVSGAGCRLLGSWPSAYWFVGGWLLGGWLLGCSLLGCGDESAPACTTKVTPEVCETPANLRTDGVAPVVWVADPELELLPEPLVDGRYLLLQRSLSCGSDFLPPAETLRLQSMVEVQGCVLRVTSIGEEGAEPRVSVSTFNYGAEGVLELSDACSAGPSEPVPTRYGFDGTTLQLPVSVELSGADGTSHACSGFDSYAL